MLKRKSKRVLSIVLAVAMIVGLFPIAAFAEGENQLPQPDSNGVITLNGDVTLTSTVTINTNTIINLNGKKISFESEDAPAF